MPFAGTSTGNQGFSDLPGATRRWTSTTSKVAPKVGLEPTTDRLTADCSTIELLWMPKEHEMYKATIFESTHFTRSQLRWQSGQ